MNWTIRHTLSVWWGLAWRVVIYGTVSATLIRACAYFVSYSGAADMPSAMSLSAILSKLCFVPVTMLALHQALAKRAVGAVPNKSFKPSPHRYGSDLTAGQGGPA